MNNLKIIFLIVLIFNTLLNSKNINSISKEKKEKVSIQLQWYDQFQFAGYYIAKEKGFYNDVGLDVDIISFKLGVNPVEEVLSKKVNFGTGRTSLIINRANGKKVILLSSILQSSPLAFVTKKSSDINKIEDFKGRKVMLTGTELSASIHALLRSKNITFDDMKLQLSKNKMKNLINDDTDIITAYTSNQIYLLQKQGLDINIFHPKDYGFDFYSDILFTNEDELKNNKQRVKNFTNASIKGWQYAFSHIDETVELILRKYNSQKKSKEVLTFEANELKRLAFHKINKDKLGHIDIHKIQRIYDIFNVMGLVENEINLDKFIFHDDKHKITTLTYKEKEYLKNKKELTVCVKKGWMPLESIENNKFIGISADFLTLYASKLSIPLKIIISSGQTESLKLFKQKKCDIKPIVGTYKKLSIPYKSTQSYMTDSIVLVTRIEQPFINDLDKLTQTVVMAKGFQSYIKYIKENYPLLKIKLVKDIDTALTLVTNGKAYGYIGQSLTSSYKIQKRFSSQLKIINDFKKLEKGIGVRDDDPQLLSILNKVMSITTNREKRKIINKWLSVTVEKEKDYSLMYQVIGVVFLFFLFLIYKNILSSKHNKELEQSKAQLLVLNKELNEREYEIVLINENLAQQKEAYKNLYQKSSDGILIIRDGKFVDCNEAVVKMLKCHSRDELLNIHPSVLSPKFQLDGQNSFTKANKMMQIAIDTGSNTFEWIHVKANGEEFWAEVVLTQMIQNNESIIHVVWRDISKRKENEFELELLTKNLEARVEEEVEKNRLQDQQMFHQSKLAQMGEMISMIAHQWRQPLNSISLTASNLKFKCIMDDINKELFEKELDLIDDYSQHLSKTIDDFRGFFRGNKEKETTSLNQIVNSTLDIVKISIDNKNIKIVTNLKCKDALKTYPSEIKQVILNIMKNAEDILLENNIKDPTITIESICNTSSNNQILIIRDNAGGIPNDIIDKIFEPYFSTKLEKDGTGLGLYMSKAIIEDHCDGKLSVSNDKDGAVFKIII